MLNEKWTPIEGYDGKYHVSNKGNIKSLKDSDNPKLLKLSKISSGEYRVNLSNNGMTTVYNVGRLVAHYFCGNDGRSVNCCKAVHVTNLRLDYKDSDKSNNCYSNLKWTIIKLKTTNDSDEKGHYTEAVSFNECNAFIETAIKAHKVILCYVYNSYDMPKTCEQAFVAAYNYTNHKNQCYICTNGYSYKNARPMIKLYKMKSPPNVVNSLIKNKWEINSTGNWTNSDIDLIFTNNMFLNCHKDVVKKPDGNFYTVKGNQKLLSDWVEER